MTRAFAIAAACLALSAGTAAAQDGKKKGDKGWKGGRIPVKRDQGSAKALQAKFEALLRSLKQRATKKAEADPPASKPAKKQAGGGIKPPPKKDDEAASRPVDKAEQALLKTLRSFAPDKKALLDVLTPEGVRSVGRPLYKASRKLFGRDVDGICERLKLGPKLETVKVFEVSTEDLASMELGTIAAKEFASGLRHTSRLLRGQYKWYCVLLKRAKAKADDPGVRLQLFVFSRKRYVYLGKIWRLDKN